MARPPTPRPAGSGPLRIALLGSRGMGHYGGYETLMAELAPRLGERGHRVTVYGRSHVVERQRLGEVHPGVRQAVLPTLPTKYLDTPVHTLLSCFHAGLAPDPFEEGFDAALVVNSANAVFVPLLTQRGIPTALHVDGIERRRAKWGRLGRAVYAVSERLACVLPTRLVTDAEVIREYYLRHWGVDSTPIAYGVDPRPPARRGVLGELGLEPHRFFLYVSRFEPENNPHRVVEAYRRVGGDLPLVMVGGAPYADRFIEDFRRRADPRVLFPGPIYGDGYRELLSAALAYVQATEVGGTHPALVEAMGYGNCLVVNDTPENREVAGPVARYFRAAEPASLAAVLEEIRRRPKEAREGGQRAAVRAARRYDWERVTDDYEVLFRGMAGA